MIFRNVQVLQWQHHVAFFKVFQERFVLAQGFPRIFNRGSAKGAGFLKMRVEFGVVGQDGHQTNAAFVGTVGRLDFNDFVGLLVFHGVVLLHVAVDELSRPIAHVLARCPMINVGLCEEEPKNSKK